MDDLISRAGGNDKLGVKTGKTCTDTISRQAAIDALDGNVIVTSRESAQAVMDYIRGCADRMRSLPSAQPDLDSAYTEGYTAAESKYRAMWDEMQDNIKEKAFGKRKGLIHTADIDAMPTIEPERKTGKWIKNIDDDINAWWYECSECGNYPLKNEYGRDDLSMYCPHCGARLLKEGEDNDS